MSNFVSKTTESVGCAKNPEVAACFLEEYKTEI